MIAVIRARLRALILWLAITVSCVIIIAWAPQARLLLYKPNPDTLIDLNQPPDSEIPIPKRIWQVFFPPPSTTIIEDGFMHANKWIEMAPGYTYTLVGSTEAEAFLAAHFADRPEIASTCHALKNPALKSDVLRYLLLYIHGGIYSDVDTKPLVRLDAWVPAQKRREVRLLLALEYDEAEEPNPSDFVYPVQFCQWTIAAAPNHTVFARMVDRMLAGLQDVADRQSTTLDKAYLSDFDVVNTTGPVAYGGGFPASPGS